MKKKTYIKPEITVMKIPELLSYDIVSASKATADEDQEGGAKGGLFFDDEEFDDEDEE